MDILGFKVEKLWPQCIQKLNILKRNVYILLLSFNSFFLIIGKCLKCIDGLKNITVSHFDIYFGGGENGKFVEKFKVNCKCGWKNEVDDTQFGPDPLNLNANELTKEETTTTTEETQEENKEEEE